MKNYYEETLRLRGDAGHIGLTGILLKTGQGKETPSGGVGRRGL